MNASLEMALAGLRQRFVDRLPARLDTLRAALAALGGAPWQEAEPAPAAARRAAHSLAGAAGTFGFALLGEIASRLEQYLDALPEIPPAQALAILNEHYAALAAQAAQAAADAPAARLPAVPATDDAVRQRQSRSIALIDNDSAFGTHLAEQIGRFGYRVAHHASLESFLATPQDGAPPDVIVMDATFSASDLAGADTPTVVLSSRDDFAARLAAVRAGAHAYLTKPPDVSALINTLDSLTDDEPPRPFRILVLEDDALLAEHYCRLLEADGMETLALGDPTRALEAAADFDPDLLLTDLNMPGCSGIELAAVIRQLEAYVSLPIVFLSAETDPDRRVLAMQQGGDDFLVKPVAPQSLIASVRQRAQRHRILRGYMEHDGLTGLLNHSALKERLALELARATRQKRPLAFAMIDLDRFKQVNDSHGHAAGDRVLRALARLLRDRLRRTDIIGRYGGEEFAVLLPDTDAAAATQVLEQIRQGFAAVEHGAGTNRFKLTLSAGIAACPSLCDAEAFAAAADAALYRSKAAGRNRVTRHDAA